MTAASFCFARNGMNAASIRIGPSRVVVPVHSAGGRKPESCRSSGSMMPAMLISTYFGVPAGHHVVGTGDRRRVRDVEDEGLDAVVLGGDLLEQFLAAAGDDHLVAG